MQRMRTNNRQPARKHLRWMGLGTLRATDLTDPQCQFSQGHVSNEEPLLEGRVKALQVHPDIWLHAVEGCDLRTLTSCTPAQQGLHIVIVLEGHVDVAFGTVPLQLPQANAAPQPAQAYGALVNLCQHEVFVRNWRIGKFERKLSLRVHPRLVQSLAHTAGYTHLQPLVAQHLCMQLWQPSARAAVLAEQIIHLASQDNAALLLQSRTLEFLHEAVQQGLHETVAKESLSLPLREHLRMSKLKAMIDAQQDGGAPVSELARQMGMSTSALQRHFRQIYGASIDEYRRHQRLEHARALLEQTGCSVLEVAHSSGYTSAANFSTAFKRRFGISPKWVRSKL